MGEVRGGWRGEERAQSTGMACASRPELLGRCSGSVRKSKSKIGRELRESAARMSGLPYDLRER